MPQNANTSDNPFALLYTQLVKLLLSNPRLVRAVESENIIRFDRPRVSDPTKGDIEEGDLPEITVIPSGFLSNIHATSNSASVTRQYSILVSTGSKRLNAVMNDVQWELFVALSNWKEALSPVQWRGASFVKRVGVVSVDEGMSDPELNRGIQGWSAIWAVEVEMRFQTSELLRFVDS
jgi:hypothetical protein